MISSTHELCGSVFSLAPVSFLSKNDTIQGKAQIVYSLWTFKKILSTIYPSMWGSNSRPHDQVMCSSDWTSKALQFDEFLWTHIPIAPRPGNNTESLKPPSSVGLPQPLQSHWVGSALWELHTNGIIWLHLEFFQSKVFVFFFNLSFDLRNLSP